MDLTTFCQTLTDAEPPPGLSPALRGLWWDAKGDWERAHQCAQDQADADGAAVHAYLHRKEGDFANACYWYHRAGRAPATDTLQAEWRRLAGELLSATAANSGAGSDRPSR